MCGIAGKYVQFGDIDSSFTKRAICLLHHRGPDSQSHSIVSAPSGLSKVSFGQTRLAIIDLDDRANAPFFIENGSVVTVFNGEVFNFIELRRFLSENFNCRFMTESDTEVISYGLYLMGIEFLKMIRGFFAVAQYNSLNESLLLTRDSMGVKPLYYSFDGQELIFSSEITPLIMELGLTELNMSSLALHLTFGAVPSPNTLVRGISKITPGNLLRIDSNGVQETCFSNLFNELPKSLNTHPNIETLDEKLRAAVRSRLVSDVQIGLLLSGGIDSGLIAHYMREDFHGEIHAVTVVSSESDPELENARKIATKYNLNHHVVFMNEKLVAETWELLSHKLDEPIPDSVCIPVYLGTKKLKELGVKVALVGEGADELFAGYDTWRYTKYATQVLNIFPRFCVSLVLKSMKFFDKLIKIDSRIIAFVEQSRLSKYGFLGGATFFSPGKLSRIEPSLSNYSTSYINHAFEKLELEVGRKVSFLEWCTLLDLKLRLPELLLMRLDKVGMLNSIEIREPFLDLDLIRFSFLYSDRSKVGLNNGKIPLRQISKLKLGSSHANKKKMGFKVDDSLKGTETWKNWISEGVKEFAKGTGISEDLMISEMNEHSRLSFQVASTGHWLRNRGVRK
jgi:asparagine synthase (glutamine-hydrolysing)